MKKDPNLGIFRQGKSSTCKFPKKNLSDLQKIQEISENIQETLQKMQELNEMEDYFMETVDVDIQKILDFLKTKPIQENKNVLSEKKIILSPKRLF